MAKDLTIPDNRKKDNMLHEVLQNFLMLVQACLSQQSNSLPHRHYSAFHSLRRQMELSGECVPYAALAATCFHFC